MKLTCNRETLNKYISSAERITGKNLSLPILNSILLITENKKLIIRSTNLEVGVEFHIPAEVVNEGSIVIQGTLLANILANISDEQEIHIEVIKGICTITTKTKILTIKGFPSDDFPTIPMINEGEKLTISSQKFTQGVKSVIMSAATSDIKPEIASIYIHQSGDLLIFAATDSFHLSERRIKQTNINLPQGIIIPVKNIMEIIKVIEMNNEEITFIITKTQISCVGKSFYITSRVIQGVYPDYEQIIPKTHTTEIIILKQDLINTLKLSTIFSDKFKKITFTINPKEKQCIISTKNTEIGETKSHITATISGDPIEISLNGKHIFDCLNSIEKDSVTIQFNGPNKPAVIRGLGDTSFTNLAMPLTR